MEAALNEHYLKELNKFLNFFKTRNSQTLKDLELDY